MYKIKTAYLVTELKYLGAESNYGFYQHSYRIKLPNKEQKNLNNKGRNSYS